ncbi:hypothetical protein [Tropicibacter oceani]|uniref:Conjugal transfer protein TraN n=1 Tax=Tropicibacter oceani TaxID=3058420 RepID=A0ABY8QLK3_9RHOB|nr:hypothetical protein [Tropicibacter oceani]WGW05519.1 hypothetical protein QF118_08220 [Tropicibacter oceani]
MKTSFLLSALALMALTQPARAGCVNYTETGSAPLAEICFDGACEKTYQEFICSTASRAWTAYANGWQAQEDVANGQSTTTISRSGQALPPQDHARVTCNTLPDGLPCDFFPNARLTQASLAWMPTTGPFDGLCLDNVEAGCNDRFIPFGGHSIGICEATCTLENPVNLRAMEGTLYDVTCQGDGPEYGNEIGSDRVLVLKQSGYEDGPRLSLIGTNYTRAIVPCP